MSYGGALAPAPLDYLASWYLFFCNEIISRAAEQSLLGPFLAVVVVVLFVLIVVVFCCFAGIIAAWCFMSFFCSGFGRFFVLFFCFVFKCFVLLFRVHSVFLFSLVLVDGPMFRCFVVSFFLVL